MELRVIRYFLAVAQRLNFCKAAQDLHISQPPLSRQIRQLEEELGVALFRRNKRHVELTSAGQVFLEEAKKLIIQADRTIEAVHRAAKGESGLIRIGIASGLGGLVSDIVVEHQTRFPTVDVECRDVFSTLQNEALRKGDIDFGFLRPPIDMVNLDCELLFREKFTVVLSKKHPLAKRRRVKLADIANQPLILFERHVSIGLFDKVMGLYRKHGLTPNLVETHTGAHEEAGAIMVGAGKAIFIGGGGIVTRTLSGVSLATLELDEPGAEIEVYLAWRKDKPASMVSAFRESVLRVCDERPGSMKTVAHA